MRILISGDSHADINHITSIYNKVEKFECDAAFVVGDYGFWPKAKNGLKFLNAIGDLDFPVYFLAGNHEDWDMLEKHVKSPYYKSIDENGFIEVHSNSFFAFIIHFINY